MPLYTALLEGRKRAEHGRGLLHPFIIVPLLFLVLIASFLLFPVSRFQPGNSIHAAYASAPVPLQGTLSPLLAHSRALGPADSNQHIALSIGLRPRNAAMLSSYVQDISRPGSVNFHHYLSPAQVAAVYGPSISNYNSVLQFLKSSGFTITHTYSHHLLITFNGTIGQAERVFHVTINKYTAPDGHTFYANTNDPAFPATIVDAVQSINGLNDATQLQPSLVVGHNALLKLAKRTVTVGKAQAQLNSIPCPQNYQTLGQISSAYSLWSLYTPGDIGQGQVMALYELDTFQLSDITNYESCYDDPFGNNLSHHNPAIQTIVTGQKPVPTDAGVLEVELDAELVVSLAPELGILKIYEAANDSADRLAEWAQIVQDAPSVVSTSWGICEKLADPAEVAQENIFFMAAAAQGQSIFAASGDTGSEGCLNQNSTDKSLNVEDPASQPYVTGVGGTTMTWDGTTTETSWNDKYGASGGGISQLWTAPSWQNAPGVHNQYSSDTPCHAPAGAICREVPDVSLNADPATGYITYCTSAAVAVCKTNGPWLIIGGTSAAAPLWATIIVLANEQALNSGYFTAGFINPVLYQLASGVDAYQSFNDITTGPNNDFTKSNNGSYPVTSGYDMVTGLGSIDAQAFSDLFPQYSQQRSSTTNKTWYFAEGSVGGGFTEYLTVEDPGKDWVRVNITYLFESRPAVVVSHIVNASTRATFSVNGDLGIRPTDRQQAVSAIVQVTTGGSQGIVVERPMYFNYKGIKSGTDVVGATNPSTSYYFPEADTRQSGHNYATYVTMLNPSSTQSTHVTLTYYTGTCGLHGQTACPTQNVVVPPLHRGTATPATLNLYQQLSIKVSSDLPVVVERPMYFSDTIPAAGGLTTGAASEVGATAPGNDWLFAEGYTGSDFQEYLVLANFGTTVSNASVILKYDNGHTQTIPVQVPALGHTYFDVNQANAHPTGSCDTSPCMPTAAVSAEVIASAPIIADRLMYFHYGPNHISGGTDVVGEAGPASHSVYAFAEGYTASSFSEYLTLQNPTQNNEVVAVTFFADGDIIEQQMIVNAHSRQTVSVNALITPIAQAYPTMGTSSYSVAMTIQVLSTGGTIVAERPMYFDYHGSPGGTDVLGYTGG